jgi:hypothetical protein
LIFISSNFDILSLNNVFAQQIILNHSQGDNGAQVLQGTQLVSNNISHFCPANTSLQLRFIKEVIADGYIVTCTLNNPFVYVTWKDNTLGNDEIFFRVSNDSGITFSPAINLSNNTENSDFSQIAAVGENVYVAWRDSPSNIFFRASDNNGKTFSTAINLSNSSGSTRYLQIAAVGDHVYVAWRDSSGKLSFKASDNNGKTFDPTKQLSMDGTSGSPVIAAFGDHVYVAWKTSTKIFFRASDNNGKTFSPAILLSNASGTPGYVQQMVTIRNNVYITWNDNVLGNPEIFFRASDNNGKTFSPAIQLSNGTAFSDRSQIAGVETLYGNFVYVTWNDFSSGNSKVFFRASDNNGKTFSPPIQLRATEGIAMPQIVAVDDHVYVVWKGGINYIFFQVSDNNGNTFSPAIDLRPTQGSAQEPKIAAVGDHVYVAWRTLSAAGYSDIYFKSSEDNGKRWGPQLNLSSSTGLNLQFQIVVPSSG